MTHVPIIKKNSHHCLDDISKMVEENIDAVYTGLNLLCQLYNQNILQTIEQNIKETNMEQILTLISYVSELHVEDLAELTTKLHHGMQRVRKMETAKKTSYMSLVKSLKDPEINESMTMILTLLKGMGGR